jgi:hypothetical protein
MHFMVFEVEFIPDKVPCELYRGVLQDISGGISQEVPHGCGCNAAGLIQGRVYMNYDAESWAD